MTDRIPGAPGRCKAVVTGGELQKMQAGEEFAITLRRDDQPIKEGTPYSKAAVLPDTLAAHLCPGVNDPAPKDAFAALYEQKADTVRHATGKVLTLRDAAHTPLMGLRVFGGGNADNSGSITIRVGGRNLADVYGFSANGIYSPTSDRATSNSYGTTLSTTEAADSLTVTQSRIINNSADNYGNGYFCIGFHSDLRDGDIVTVSFDVEITNNLSDNNDIAVMPNGDTAHHTTITDGRFSFTVPWKSVGAKRYLEIRNGGKSMIISNIQVEYGNVATDYEPYFAPQTLTVLTPIGLDGDEYCRDEIDFGKGVLIRRVSENQEYPLPEEVLETYAKLHTYGPVTVISNDAGLHMEAVYYTPTTAVQMVHGTANKGKTFTVDEHGCVALTRNNPVIACGQTTIDGCDWYYRKWADGLAECWTEMFCVYDSIEGNTSSFEILLPFFITTASGNVPPQTFITLQSHYDYAMVTGVEDIGECLSKVWVAVPSYAAEDTEIMYTAKIYITGYWKTPEVTDE